MFFVTGQTALQFVLHFVQIGKNFLQWENYKHSTSSQKRRPSDPGNYRPIAICSNLAKVMESILNHKLMKYLEDNSLRNDRQYGFRKNRSNGDLMALLTETWNRSVHFFGESKVVALDISNALDRLWHQGLISKVKSYGVGNTFIRWLSDFLSVHVEQRKFSTS